MFLFCSVSERFYLDLLHRQIQEGVLVADADQTLGAFAAHAGPQTSIQFDHGELVEALADVVGEPLGLDPVIRLDLTNSRGHNPDGNDQNVLISLKCEQPGIKISTETDNNEQQLSK